MTIHAKNRALNDFGSGHYNNSFVESAAKAYDREWREVAQGAAREISDDISAKVVAALSVAKFAETLRLLGRRVSDLQLG